MSSVGFYRFKLAAPASETDVYFAVNGSVVATKTVLPLEACTNDLILKYIDENGQYRFYPFSRFFETYDTPAKIGSTDKFLTSILSDQSDKRNIGYTNSRQIDATAEADADQLEKLKALYTSPRVYLYTGSGQDTATDWLEVEVRAGRPIVKRRKANAGSISITIVLPKHYTITML